MNDDLYIRKMHEQYDSIFQQCISLNTELHALVPLAKKMHLLSSNAVSSAARAGSKGDAFRVLTHDIQLLGVDVSQCIEATQKVIVEIVMLASTLARLFASYRIYRAVLIQTEQFKQSSTSHDFFYQGQQKIAREIGDINLKLERSLNLLADILSPISMLIKKGDYLAVFSAVEAASAGEYEASFDAVSSMLRELVTLLGKQSQRQRFLLRDLSETMALQQNNIRSLLNAR
ncbi:MAG: hypothetical protein P1P93_04110 [Gammaproteobacteria bacterium]|nr:hypothetical protein [Gammaproteobacteria bacterium]